MKEAADNSLFGGAQMGGVRRPRRKMTSLSGLTEIEAKLSRLQYDLWMYSFVLEAVY